MASAVNFTGLASGIDSNSLIQSLLDSERKVKIKPLQDKVSALTDTNKAFSDLKGFLGSLNDSADKFRAINGGAIAKQSTSSNETIANASASNAAVNGTYTLTVSQLAKNGSASFNDRFASSTSTINASINNGAASANRTVTVTVGTGSNQESVAVTLTNATTLTDFVNSFNASSNKAEASVVNVGSSASPSYALSIVSNDSGTEDGQIGISVGSEVSTAGSGAFVTNTISQATDANFTLSGITGTITRGSNSISDVLTGVTLNLNTTGAATIKVSNDTESSTQYVQDFVDAYNEVVSNVAKNNTITRDESGNDTQNIFAPLASSSVDNNALSALRQALSGAGISSGGSVNVLADLGITTNRDGTLAFDSSKFSDALSNDSSSTGQILENLGETLSAVGGTIDQFTQFNGLIDNTVTANSSQISSAQSRIADIEKRLSQEQESLTRRYAGLESLIGKLNSQQNALSSLLPR